MGVFSKAFKLSYFWLWHENIFDKMIAIIWSHEMNCDLERFETIQGMGSSMMWKDGFLN